MTEDEKIKHPKHSKTGGYLKQLSYKDAFCESLANAPLKDIIAISELPNFDNNIFKEISGYDIQQRINDDDSVGVEKQNAINNIDALKDTLKALQKQIDDLKGCFE